MISREVGRATLKIALQRLAARPRDAQTAQQIADIALDHGFEAEAVSALEASARLIGQSPTLWQMLALLHRALEATEEAIAAFQRAARLAPRDVRIAHGLALTTQEAGRPAVALYDAALKLAPLDGELLLGRSAALVAEGAMERAASCLAALLVHHPGWLAGHHAFAKIKAMEGRADAATETLHAALRLHPRDPNLHAAHLAILARVGTPDSILSAVTEARGRAGSLPAFAKAEAMARSEADDIAGADAIFATTDATGDPAFALARVRHELRAVRPESVDRLAEPLTATGEAVTAWAYRATAWRMLDDPRLDWLESSEMVGVYDIADQLPPLDRLAGTLRAIHATRAHPIDQSVRGGTQTDGPLFARAEPDIRAARKAVAEAVRRHVANLPPPDARHPFLSAGRHDAPRFAGSWSVRLAGAGRHVNHVHTHGWLSSALYVSLPDDMATGERGLLQIGASPEELGLDLPAVRSIVPKPGRLVLFPSTMWHGTTPFAAGERLTIAFDVARPQE